MRFISLLLFLATLTPALQASERAPHPLFTPMSGYRVSAREEQEFTARKFKVAPGKEDTIEGRLLSVGYFRESGLPDQSGFAVFANHRNALKPMGGELVYLDGPADNPYYMTFKVSKGGQVTWGELDLTAGGNDFRITTVTVGAMKQEVTGGQIDDALAREGRLALYGILFDTGKSTLRPESDSQLKAIADMMKAKANRKVFVVGHTDNVGSLESNLTLSQARAEAVVSALGSRFGVPAGRMVAKGVGQLSPVATNATEEGRQQNRRVEVVAQ